MTSFADEILLIDQGNLRPVYLLWGGEYFLEEQAIQALFSAFAGTDPASVERKNFYGDDRKDEPFIQSLVNFGMFAPRQFLTYKNIQKLNVSHRKSLQRYIDSPDPNILLILTADNETKSSLVDQLKKSKSIKTIYSFTPEPEQFAGIVRTALARRGYTISDDAMTRLVTCTDDSLAHTFAELEKIIVAAGDANDLSFDAVDAVIGAEKKYQVSELLSAVANRDIKKSVKIALSMIHAGEGMPFIVSKLFHFFLNIWAYPHASSFNGDKNRRNQKQEADFKVGYGNYRDRDFGKIFQCLTDVDLKSKSVNLTDEELIVPLLYEIINA